MRDGKHAIEVHGQLGQLSRREEGNWFRGQSSRAARTPVSPRCRSPEFADPFPGYGYVGEECIAASYRLPDELKRRTIGVVRFAGDTGQIPDIESHTDLIRVAAHRYVTQLEQQFNNGQPFPDPGANNHRDEAPTTRVNGRTAPQVHDRRERCR
jgi:hypothetical protein